MMVNSVTLSFCKNGPFRRSGGNGSVKLTCLVWSGCTNCQKIVGRLAKITCLLTGPRLKITIWTLTSTRNNHFFVDITIWYHGTVRTNWHFSSLWKKKRQRQWSFKRCGHHILPGLTQTWTCLGVILTAPVWSSERYLPLHGRFRHLMRIRPKPTEGDAKETKKNSVFKGKRCT